MNRHFPKDLNCHGNSCAAILNGAMMLSVVWKTRLYGQGTDGVATQQSILGSHYLESI